MLLWAITPRWKNRRTVVDGWQSLSKTRKNSQHPPVMGPGEGWRARWYVVGCMGGLIHGVQEMQTTCCNFDGLIFCMDSLEDDNFEQNWVRLNHRLFVAYAQALCIIGLAEDLEEDQGYSMELAPCGGFFPHAASDLATIHNSHAHHKHGRGLWKIVWVPPEVVWQNA